MSSTADLEAELVDLGTMLDAPSGDGVAPAVLARLPRHDGRALAATPTRRTPLLRRRLVVAGAALAAIVAGAVAGPAVADWFGVRGVSVERDDSATPPTTGTTPPSGVPLDLGESMASLAAAEAAAGFAAAVPGALGQPDAIWVDRRGDAPFITLVYDDGPLVTEFDATLAADAIIRKMAGPGTTVEQLTVHGEPAMWIEGVHEVAVRGRDGDYVFERLRISDRVLLVQHGALTVRIETAAGMGRDDAVRIADSLPR